MIVIYGSENCQYCTMAKNLCESKDVEYQYKMVGTDISIEALKDLCPKPVRTVPQIFQDGVYVGGFQELSKSI